MHHVIVGAGAVGVVYADALMRAGHTVTYLVREKYVDVARAGERLYVGKDVRSVVPSGVVSSPDALAARAREVHVDVLWWCVPSNALDDTAFVAQVIEAVGDALVVELSGGPSANAAISSRVPRERRIDGIIAYLAWQTPLPDGMEPAREKGIALYCPPGPSSVFSGPRARVVVDALRAGGLRASVDADVTTKRAIGSALLTSFVIALEAAAWKLDDAARTLGNGAREALAVMSRETGRSAFPLTLVARPLVVRVVIALAKRVMPLPLETYLHHHFMKVRTQMHQNVRGILALADAQKSDAHELRALSQKVGALTS
jgi:ketopantoate reductase